MFVLNIDDDADDGYIFMEAVKEIHPTATCLLISKGEDALRFLSSTMGILPDYIFLDINMPGMDGRECLAKLREIKKLKEVPIVMFSTSIPEKDRPQFHQLNAACCQKPSDFLSLRKTLRNIIVKS